MSTKNKLESLLAAFDKKTNNSSSNSNWKLFYQFWKIPDDSTAIVRFLPDKDDGNPLNFLVENLHHELTINGKRETVPCMSMYGHKCPICELSRKYYDDENEEMGKKYYKKKSYVGQVIVVESPIDHDQTQLVKLIEFGPAVFKAIHAGFKSGDLDEVPYEFKGGYNFRIKKTKNGQYASYSTSSFAPKASDLEDDLISSLELYDLKQYRTPEIDMAKLEAMLVADMTGTSVEDAEADDAPASTPAPKAEVSTPKVETPAPKEEVASEGGSSAAAVLARLRSRTAAE
jgi:hypothetical protein